MTLLSAARNPTADSHISVLRKVGVIMPTMQWVISEMESWAPISWAEGWDNVGLLIGDASEPIKKILVALDATDAVIQEAIAGKYDCIITHHPIIRDPVKNITSSDITGRKILSLIKHGISLYTAHTNLDKAPGGVNDCLAEKLGISPTIPLAKDTLNSEIGIGRIGELPNEITLGELANHVKKSLNLKDIRYSGDISTAVKKIAMCGGSGMSFWQAVKDANCDVYITGDVKYSDALVSLSEGICIIDVTHYSGENIIVDTIVERLRAKALQGQIALEINPTSIDGQTFQTL